MKITLTFDQTMISRNMTNIDIQLTFYDGAQLSSKPWNAQLIDKELTVSYSTEQIPVSYRGEKIELRLVNVEAFKTEHSMPLSTTYSYTFNTLGSQLGVVDL